MKKVLLKIYLTLHAKFSKYRPEDKLAKEIREFVEEGNKKTEAEFLAKVEKLPINCRQCFRNLNISGSQLVLMIHAVESLTLRWLMRNKNSGDGIALSQDGSIGFGNMAESEFANWEIPIPATTTIHEMQRFVPGVNEKTAGKTIDFLVSASLYDATFFTKLELVATTGNYCILRKKKNESQNSR
jgi:hypothetical protein